MKKRMLALTMAAMLGLFSLTACANNDTSSGENATNQEQTDEPEKSTEPEETKDSQENANSNKDKPKEEVSAAKPEEGKTYKIGVCQLVQHDALDSTYQGFVDALAEAGFVEGENLTIDYQNASGEQANCVTIASKLVNDQNDLILAIATQAAQACANATSDIPILVTAVTDPAASGLVTSNDAPGKNVTGTSDLNPITEQMDLLLKLVPDAKKVAVLYCSSETNSKIQADMAIEAGKAIGLTVTEETVSNSNEIQQVVQSLADKVDAIYAPTDNMIAAGMATVAMVANENGIPVICGESGMVENGGLATYGINYYELGKMTGIQATKILAGQSNPADMPIEYLDSSKLEISINKKTAEKLKIEIPADLQ